MDVRKDLIGGGNREITENFVKISPVEGDERWRLPRNRGALEVIIATR